MGCQSSSLKPATPVEPPQNRAAIEVNTAPDSQPLREETLDGAVFTLSGKPTTAKLISAGGESRRPLAASASEIYFSGRRPGLERWQVFNGLLTENIERRISYDAGEVEPVALLRQGSDYRLVISSTSRATRQTNRLLAKYQNLYTLDAASSNKGSGSTSSSPTESLQHELFLEVPAAGKRGTQWVSILGEASLRKQLSFEREGKTGVLLAGLAENARAFRMVISAGSQRARQSTGREPKIRWVPLSVQRPSGFSDAELTSAAISPDATRIAWSNGSQIWTTDLEGRTPVRLGDDSILAQADLLYDPTGNWLIFSTPTATRGLNLMALHRSGRCPRVLTEIPGDESDPSLSPDGKSLFFTQTQGGIARVARTNFVNSERELTETSGNCEI